MSNLIFVSWLLYVGFMPAASLDIEDTVIHFDNTFIQVAGVNFQVADFWRVWTEIEIRETKTNSIYFDPYRAGFRIGTELYFKDFSLGVFHECDHDIVTYSDLHPYNGIDFAFENWYTGWSSEFNINQNITLKPLLFMGILVQNGIFIKSNEEDEYLGYDNFIDYGTWRFPSNNFFFRFGGDADLFNFIKLHAVCQPEYSMTHNVWSRIRIETGVEFYYRDVALGFEFKNQVKFDNSSWAFNEFALYVSFRGHSPLL